MSEYILSTFISLPIRLNATILRAILESKASLFVSTFSRYANKAVFWNFWLNSEEISDTAINSSCLLMEHFVSNQSIIKRWKLSLESLSFWRSGINASKFLSAGICRTFGYESRSSDKKIRCLPLPTISCYQAVPKSNGIAFSQLYENVILSSW